MGLLSGKIKNPIQSQPKSDAPLWSGPNGGGVNGGITFSLLSRWCVCRERFRILTVKGLKPNDEFNHRLEFGNMWHLCEENYRNWGSEIGLAGVAQWELSLTEFAQKLANKYRHQQEQVYHWYEICRRQFPVYLDFWEKNPDVAKRKNIFAEQVFDVPYKLPSGRIVRLRGKWDGGDVVDKSGIYLQENKTKNDINEVQIVKQLSYDLQTMLYLIALHESRYSKGMVEVIPKGTTLNGVIYNVVKRHCPIRQHKPSKKEPLGEDREHFYNRLVEDYFRAEPKEWFMRWKVEISSGDIQIFKTQTLDPILENVCHWWDHISGKCDPTEATHGIPPSHWRHPYVVYNPLDEGGSGEVDEYLRTGSEVGLYRTNNLFPELQDLE